MQQDIKYFELMEWLKMMENEEKLKEYLKKKSKKKRYKNSNNRKIKVVRDNFYFDDLNLDEKIKITH